MSNKTPNDAEKLKDKESVYQIRSKLEFINSQIPMNFGRKVLKIEIKICDVIIQYFWLDKYY